VIGAAWPPCVLGIVDEVGIPDEVGMPHVSPLLRDMGDNAGGFRSMDFNLPSPPKQPQVLSAARDFVYAARSLTATGVRLQQSPTINHAPNRRHTRTYFPRSGTLVPSGLWMTTEKRPSSIAMSPE